MKKLLFVFLVLFILGCQPSENSYLSENSLFKDETVLSKSEKSTLCRQCDYNNYTDSRRTVVPEGVNYKIECDGTDIILVSGRYEVTLDKFGEPQKEQHIKWSNPCVTRQMCMGG